MVRRLADRLPKRTNLRRLLQHLPVGVGVGAAVLVHPVLAAFLFAGFLAYELLEDWRIGDHSYMDVNGFLIGIGIATGVIAGMGW